MKAESAGQGMACGEAPMRHLAGNGARTASGAPGFHPLGHCAGMPAERNAGAVSHVQARNGQGAGVTVEGRARAAGKIGVAVVISGRGATALGQCHSHNLPTLLISTRPEAISIGRSWCLLPEIAEQERMTVPLCAGSAAARRVADGFGLLARVRSILSSQCPRPCHISPRHGVQVGIVEENREPVTLPHRHAPSPNEAYEAARMHRASLRPMVLFGDVNVGAVSGLTVAARAQGAPRTGLAGDSRSRVPMPRLETVAEARLAMPIVIPEHGNPNRIRGDLRNRDTFRVGVEGIGPDIAAPAGACLRHGTRVDGATGFRRSVSAGVRRRLSDHGYCRMVGLTVAAPAGARGNVSKVLP